MLIRVPTTKAPMDPSSHAQRQLPVKSNRVRRADAPKAPISSDEVWVVERRKMCMERRSEE